MSCEYHDFKVISMTPEEQVEVCKLCGFKKRYRKIQERINNTEYLKDHARDFCQPGGRTDKLFQRFYGNNLDKR